MLKAIAFRVSLLTGLTILFAGGFFLADKEAEAGGNILVYGTWDGGAGYSYTFYNDDLPDILQNQGYSVTVTDRVVTPTITASLLAPYDQLWLLNTEYSSPPGCFSQTEIDTILNFRETGHGLLISADNTDPSGGGFAHDVNQVSVLLGVTFYGLVDHGGPQITPVFETHPLFCGVTTIHGNDTEAYISATSPADVVATYEGDNIIAVLDDGLGKVVFDNTFLRFFDGSSYILIGDNPQYVRHIADWLTGYICGDVNGEGAINSADVVYLINYLFVYGPAPEPLAAGDANCDGSINSADVAYLINYLFVGGPPPGC